VFESSSANLSKTQSASQDTDRKSNEMTEFEQMKLYAATETARVNRWRLLVIISILVTGAAVSCLTYLTLSNAQTSNANDAVRYNNTTI
jgi:hypothetical protein